MSFEFKYRSDRRRARDSSQQHERRHSPEHKNRHRQDKIRKTKWQKRSRSRSRSNHKQDKYPSHDHGSYKREQKYNSKQTQYYSRENDKRQSRYHEDERWRETQKKQKNRNEQSRKRYEEDNRKVYERTRRDQEQKLIQRKESQKREKSFSERKRERSPSSHSLSSGKREVKIDKQVKEDKRQLNTLSRQETYKQNNDDKEEPTKSRYIRRKADMDTLKRQTSVIKLSPLKQDVKRTQNIVEKWEQQNRIIKKNEVENKNDELIKEKANSHAILSGLKFGVKCVFPPPPPKHKKVEEPSKRQPQKQIQNKQIEDRNQLLSKQSKIDKQIAELSPIKRQMQERVQTKPIIIPSKIIESKLQKLKISKYQLMLSEAKYNLEIAPPPSNFLILDTFKNMNKFYVETVDTKWATLLRHDLEQYDNFKEKTMGKLQLQGDEVITESKQWMWLKQERNEQQLDLKFKLQELRQQSMSLNELVRKLRFID